MRRETRPARRPAARRHRTGKPRGIAGRPPTGVRPGERLTDYKQITVRLPPDTVAQLKTLVRTLERPQWRVMTEAIAVFASTRPEALAPDSALVQGALAIAHRAARRPGLTPPLTDHDLFDERGLPA